MTHESESEVSTMCNLSQTVKEEGCQEGLIDGILLSLKNLMKTKVCLWKKPLQH